MPVFFSRMVLPLSGLLLLCNAAMARVTLPILDEPAVKQSCQSALDKARSQVVKLESLPLKQAKVGNTLGAWNRMQMGLEDAVGPVDLYANVHVDKNVRDAADACLLQVNDFNTELFQNEKLYRRIKAVQPHSAPAKKLKKDLLEDFEDTGVALAPAKRERVKAILKREEELRQDFDRNVRDNKTKLTFTPAEMKGLPEDFIARAKRDEQGNYLLGFDYPDYIPFVTNADDEAARQRYYMAFTNRGTPRNIELMNEIMALRLEMAKLHGLPSYAAFATRRKMVEDPATVTAFLKDVKDAVRDAEIKEVEELRVLKAKAVDKPLAEVKINRWDVAYYQEKLRKARYDIDQEALRKYFPTDASIQWAMLVSSKLYGIRFEETKVPVWHPDVRYFDVLDAASGKFLGGVYLDLYPRDGKYKHAAAFGIRGVSRLAGRTPVSVLVTNFNRDGLNHDELETMMHEFGHVLHGVLSRADYNPHAGTSVVRDFVEAPSQMFEEWARKPESLKLFKEVCPSCPTLDDALIKRLDEARKYGMGSKYARQHLYADFDMALTGEQPRDAMETWKKMEGESPLGYVEGTAFPGSFSHIVGGYAAGYYGYMWSEVLALDMLSKFGTDIMNPAVGRRFRNIILANGGQVKAKELVREFLGRAPDNRAFFAEITGQR
jgi:thimet oligopeptidase